MSRRARERRNRSAERARTAARLLANRAPNQLTCAYGVHDWAYSDTTKTCTKCGGVYVLTAAGMGLDYNQHRMAAWVDLPDFVKAGVQPQPLPAWLGVTNQEADRG